MISKRFFTILMCLISLTATAQREFWGLYRGHLSFSPLFPSEYGSIVKLDFNGENLTVKHEFDSFDGKFPLGRLFMASDGKLYGTTSEGGNYFPPPQQQSSGGVLFQYDVILDQMNVVTAFGTGNLSAVYNPWDGVIEPITGFLYGTTSTSSIYTHNIVTGSTTFAANVPSFMTQGNNVVQNEMSGELTAGSNGIIYGTTKKYSSCPIGAPNLGSIASLNPVNNLFNYLYPFNCTVVDGWYPTGALVECSPGKLYGTTVNGGNHGYENGGIGDGIIFEYNFITNTFLKKFDFNAQTIGTGANPLINGGNGKLYGLLTAGNGILGSANYYGALYEYDTLSDSVTILKQFGNEFPSIVHPKGHLVKGSDGNLYGVCDSGVFKYDFATTEATLITSSNKISSIIEVCRKPGFKDLGIWDFELCSGSPFTFDLHNLNASSYVWKKDNVILPTQTTGELFIDFVTASDSGEYVCELTNECGTTTTPAITITVNPSDASTVTSSIPSLEDHILLCPGNSIILTGNIYGGVWNTGETTESITISEAGSYNIININACGETYSNTVSVGLYEIPTPITITYDPQSSLCLGGQITFTGNEGGLWPDGSSGTTYTTIIDTTTEYFVTQTTECDTFTSNVIQFTEEDLFDTNVMPLILPQGAPSICEGSSLTLNSNWFIGGAADWAWYKLNPLTYISHLGTITVTEPGTYILERNSYCYGSVTSEPLEITVVTEDPEIPMIIVQGNEPENSVVFVCEGEDITLEGMGENLVWNTGENTPTIVVTAGEANTSTMINVTAHNGCGSSTSEDIYIASIPLPDGGLIVNNNILTAVETNNVSYQWLDCGEDGEVAVEIEGQTQQNYTASQPGVYAVIVTNQSGCESTSICITVTEEDLLDIKSHDILQNSIVLYPNPASHNIILQTSLEMGQIIVVNMLGQIVLRTEGINEIEISELPAGHYILIAHTVIGKWRGKFIKMSL